MVYFHKDHQILSDERRSMHSVSVDSQIGRLTVLTCLRNLILNPQCNTRIILACHKPPIVHKMEKFQHLTKYDKRHLFDVLRHSILIQPPQMLIMSQLTTKP